MPTIKIKIQDESRAYFFIADLDIPKDSFAMIDVDTLPKESADHLLSGILLGVLSTEDNNTAVEQLSAQMRSVSGESGGGGAIALQQDGIEVQSAASTLNFKDGLYVDEQGAVTTTAPASNDWTIDLADAGAAPSAASYVSTTNTYAGTIGAGFESLTVGGYATIIPTNTYFEIELPSTSMDMGVLLIQDEAASATSLIGFLGGPVPTNEHVAVVFMGGNVSSSPATGIGTSLSGALAGPSVRFGIELAASGVYHHSAGVRTKIRDAMTGDYTLSALALDQTAASTRTCTIYNDATLPAGVEAGVTTLALAPDKVHPDLIFSTDYVPPGIANQQEMMEGTVTDVRAMSPAGISQAIDGKLRLMTHSDFYNSSKTGDFRVDMETFRKILWGMNGYEVRGYYDNGGTPELSLSIDKSMFTITRESVGHYRFRFQGTEEWTGMTGANGYQVVATAEYGKTARVAVATSSYFDVYVGQSGSHTPVDGAFHFSVKKHGSIANIFAP
jgi:hypothetical protein